MKKSNHTLTVSQVAKYSEVMKNIDLERLLSNNGNVLKLPKCKKLHRTLSLSRELRRLHKDYFYFHDNAIAVEIVYTGLIKKKIVLMVATASMYRIRVDVWTMSGGSHFFYKDIEQPTGDRLLWELVSLEILDPSYLPEITKYHEKLNDL